MAQLRSRFGLATKTRSNFAPEGQLGRQELDCNLALESAVAGEVDDPHSATADLSIYFVALAKDAFDVRSELGVRRRSDGFGHSGGSGGIRRRLERVV